MFNPSLLEFINTANNVLFSVLIFGKHVTSGGIFIVVDFYFLYIDFVPRLVSKISMLSWGK